ncbi:hypothetical protein CD178_02902 [Komagataeibacter saccharivorans]|uniref:Uncharacterized protein n=1 Tax=Komagataeibacter saccharivorans TaxID=265959 RepID=A0A347WFK5_9PROT|nr:hypothetical protein CD178_02902 [Komagataeibacter saccharivorans]
MVSFVEVLISPVDMQVDFRDLTTLTVYGTECRYMRTMSGGQHYTPCNIN